MKFALAQLRKYGSLYNFEEELDLNPDLKGFEDIISLGICKVKGTIKERGIDNYLFEFNIQVELIVEDSITLEPIPYQIDVNSSEIYTKDKDNEDATYIELETIDTKEAIIAEILSSKPMSYSLHEYEDDNSEDVEEEYVNPAFASLKDLL